MLRGSSFTGSGGTDAYGIYNAGSGAILEAESVSALGEYGTDENIGLSSSTLVTITLSVLEGATNSVYRTNGSVHLSNSRLVGGPVSGTVTCVAVSQGGTFKDSGCP